MEEKLRRRVADEKSSKFLEYLEGPNVYERQSSGMRPYGLQFYHELPEYKKDNNFIRWGYVPELKSFKKCYKSLFYLHNESVNIYSHLLPALVTLFAVVYYVENYLPIYQNYLGNWEKVNFIQFGTAVTICLCTSSTFHCIKAHSFNVSVVGNKLDYIGIIVLIYCSLLSIILFALYDMPGMSMLFLLVFTIFAATCIVFVLDHRLSDKYYRPHRSLMFIMFGLSGVIPFATEVYGNGLRAASEKLGIKWLILEGFFYISGAMIYVMRVPERLTHIEQDHSELLKNPIKGKFDMFGHSHQIFHIMVVIAAYCHWKALLHSYHYLHRVILHVQYID